MESARLLLLLPRLLVLQRDYLSRGLGVSIVGKARVERHVEELLLINCLRGDLHLELLRWLLNQRDWLILSLLCLGKQTKALVQAWLLQLLRQECSLDLRLHLLLRKLLCHVQPLLEDLYHVVILLLLEHELLVEDFVDVDDRVFDLCQHLLELVLETGDDFLCHGLLELLLNHSPYRGVICSGEGNAALTGIDLNRLPSRSDAMGGLGGDLAECFNFR